MSLANIIKLIIAVILIFALIDLIKVPRWGRFGGPTSSSYWGIDRVLYVILAVILFVWALGILDRLI